MEHLNITVTGRVQGVFYRKFTEMKALDLEIKGFVKNMPDGSVYIEAEAPKEILDIFLAWCHTGSPLAKVKDVTWEKGPLKDFATFVVEK